MNRSLTHDELRIAARQAITLALSMKDESERNYLLNQAQRLLTEARESQSH